MKALVELCCSSTLWESNRSLNSHPWALMCIQLGRRVKAKSAKKKCKPKAYTQKAVRNKKKVK